MCKYSKNYVQIGYPRYVLGKESPHDYKVNSIYDVHCNVCGKFVNLLSGEEIEANGRVKLSNTGHL